MNCLEFRRLNLSDPSRRGDAFLDHRRDCPDCARFAGDVEELDGKLLDVMRVPVPEELATRIKLRQVISDEHGKRRLRPWQYALAASVFVSVSLSAFFGWQVYATNQYIDQLRLAVVEHVKQEPQFLTGQVDSAGHQFKRVLAAFGGKVVDDIAPINHAEICALQHKNEPVAHSVFKGQRGPVTVLYLRGEPVAENIPFSDSGMKGVLVPAGRGNLAVIGGQSEPLETIVKRLSQGIVWKI